MAYVLHIGEKNYSSWSLRPWVLLRQAGIPFEERTVSLQPDAGTAARCVSAEMHAGFGALPAMREWEAGARSEPALADHDLDALHPDDPPAAG